MSTDHGTYGHPIRNSIQRLQVRQGFLKENDDLRSILATKKKGGAPGDVAA
jgi:hypothetical protein